MIIDFPRESWAEIPLKRTYLAEFRIMNVPYNVPSHSIKMMPVLVTWLLPGFYLFYPYTLYREMKPNKKAVNFLIPPNSSVNTLLLLI